MEQLPKIVREKLRSGAPAEHPDADLLTAYVERTLDEGERTQAALHLATCSQCRQVVALTTEAASVTSSVRQHTFHDSWLRWPVLRWAALAACVVVVGAAVVIGYRPARKSTAVDTLVVSDKQQISPPPVVEQKQVQAPGQASANQSTNPPAVAGRRNESRRKETTAETTAFIAPRRDASELKVKKDDELAFSANAPKSVPEEGRAPATPAANLDATVSGFAPPATVSTNVLEAGHPGPAADKAVGINAPAPAVVATAKAKAMQRAPTRTTSTVPVNHGLLETAASAPAGSMPDLRTPKWSLTADGLPQRSFDSGNTWEKIQVDHKTGFRALSATAIDVWVGGSSGLLYHSADMGLNWTRIIPVSNANTLSADITRIDFTDALHGQLTTATGEKWLTTDGGKTWQLR